MSTLRPFPKKHLNKPTLILAKSLLGSYLVSKSQGKTTVGKIVETEAYLFKDDPACHAGKGMSKRNKSMFEAAGISYVYLIYGMYYCFNVVSGEEGEGEAVLIRALEPVEGVEVMSKRRGQESILSLCSGPGKLCQALGITKEYDGVSLGGPELELCRGSERYNDNQIATGPRIGINKGQELPYRFWISGSKFISR